MPIGYALIPTVELVVDTECGEYIISVLDDTGSAYDTLDERATIIENNGYAGYECSAYVREAYRRVPIE